MEATLDVGKQLTVRDRGNRLLVYRYGGVPKPFFHPILLGDGTEAPLTLASAYDHPHHRGLWFCWKFVNDANFWEEQPVCHHVLTRHLAVDNATVDAVRWTSELDWQQADETIVLNEHRVLAVRQPQDDDGGRRWYAIDFDLSFLPASQSVHLSLLTVEEQPWGGYAGLGYRPARAMDTAWQLVTSNGPATTTDKGVPARWADYSGRLDGTTQAGGIAIFDHPENVRHPPPFFVLSPPTFGFLNPSPLFREGITLQDGDVLRLRYRALVHSGLGEQGWIDDHYQTWVGAR